MGGGQNKLTVVDAVPRAGDRCTGGARDDVLGHSLEFSYAHDHTKYRSISFEDHFARVAIPRDCDPVGEQLSIVTMRIPWLI